MQIQYSWLVSSVELVKMTNEFVKAQKLGLPALFPLLRMKKCGDWYVSPGRCVLILKASIIVVFKVELVLNCFLSPLIFFFEKKEKRKKESRKTVGAAQLSRLLGKILPGVSEEVGGGMSE